MSFHSGVVMAWNRHASTTSPYPLPCPLRSGGVVKAQCHRSMAGDSSLRTHTNLTPTAAAPATGAIIIFIYLLISGGEVSALGTKSGINLLDR